MLIAAVTVQARLFIQSRLCLLDSVSSVRRMTKMFAESSTWEGEGKRRWWGNLGLRIAVAALGAGLRSQVFLEGLRAEDTEDTFTPIERVIFFLALIRSQNMGA